MCNKMKALFTKRKIGGYVLFTLAIFCLITSFVVMDIKTFLAGIILFICSFCFIILTKHDAKDDMFSVAMILLMLPFFIALFIVDLKTRKIWFTDLHMDQWISLFGSLLAYFGTILLGTISMWQNQKLQKTNEDLQKSNDKYRNLSMAPFLTFLNVSELDFSICKSDYYTSKFENYKGLKIEFEGTKSEENKSISYFIITFTAINSSEYPITQIIADFTQQVDALTIKNHTETALYLGAHESKKITIIVPLVSVEVDLRNGNEGTKSFQIRMRIVNAFQFETIGTVYAYRTNNHTQLLYKIAQFTDINPLSKDKIVND